MCKLRKYLSDCTHVFRIITFKFRKNHPHVYCSNELQTTPLDFQLQFFLIKHINTPPLMPPLMPAIVTMAFLWNEKKGTWKQPKKEKKTLWSLEFPHCNKDWRFNNRKKAIIFAGELKHHQSHLITILIPPQSQAESCFVAQGWPALFCKRKKRESGGGGSGIGGGWVM